MFYDAKTSSEHAKNLKENPNLPDPPVYIYDKTNDKWGLEPPMVASSVSAYYGPDTKKPVIT